MVPLIFSINNRMLVISSIYVNNQSQDSACQLEKLFPTQFPWQWSINLMILLRFRFQEYSGQFPMLLVDGSFERGLFRHLSNHVFGVCSFRNTKFMRVIFSSESSRFNLYFKNAAKNSEKVFYFIDNCIWIGIVKFSLLRKGYLSSASNVLTTSPYIWHVNNRDFL